MVTMYEIVRFLCDRDGISIAQMCRDTGLRQGLISDLKHGRSKSLSAANMQKIANYFQVSTDIFNDGVFEEALPGGADMELLEDIQRKFSIKNESAKSEPPVITDADLKFALFGGDGEITDAMFEEVKRFAAFVKQREQEKEAKKD